MKSNAGYCKVDSKELVINNNNNSANESKKRKHQDVEYDDYCYDNNVKHINNTYNEEIYKELIDTTINLITCLICSDIMYPPITNQCNNGHNFCESCSKRMKSKCPTCRDHIRHSRNLALESIAAPIKVCCKYESLGCSAYISYRNIAQHISKCKYEGFECCPFNSCHDKISFHSNDSIKKHFKDKHGIEVAKERSPKCMKYEARLFVRNRLYVSQSKMIILFEHKGSLFLEQMTQDGDDIYVRVRGIGKKNDFEKTTITYIISDKNNKRYTVTEAIKNILEVYGTEDYKEADALFKFRIDDLLDNFESVGDLPDGCNISSGVKFYLKICHSKSS